MFAVKCGLGLVVCMLCSRGSVDVICTRLCVWLSAGMCGSSPLWIASKNGHSGVVQCRLSRGVDVNVQRRGDSVTPLWVACAGGHTAVVAALLSAGAPVTACGSSAAEAVHPLDLALMDGNMQLAMLLQRKRPARADAGQEQQQQQQLQQLQQQQQPQRQHRPLPHSLSALSGFAVGDPHMLALLL